MQWDVQEPWTSTRYSCCVTMMASGHSTWNLRTREHSAYIPTRQMSICFSPQSSKATKKCLTRCAKTWHRNTTWKLPISQKWRLISSRATFLPKRLRKSSVSTSSKPKRWRISQVSSSVCLQWMARSLNLVRFHHPSGNACGLQRICRTTRNTLLPVFLLMFYVKIVLMR